MTASLARQIHQGELFFGAGDGFLRTLLGSCVAVVLWHEGKRLAGMCHIVLPDSSQTKGLCDDRFADCVIDKFVEKIKAAGTMPEEYWVGVYGGGNMFPGTQFKNTQPIGEKNLDAVCSRLHQFGFRIKHKDIGGTAYRSLTMDMRTGVVTLKNTEMPEVG